MEYRYKFEKIRPKDLFVQIRYSAEGHPDQLKNFVAASMEKEALKEMAERYAQVVVKNWENIEAAPSEVDFAGEEITTIYTEAPIQTIVRDEYPSYNPFTEKVEERIVETSTEVRTTYTVVPLSAEEIPIVEEKLVNVLRRDRDLRLAATDFIQFSDTREPSQEWLEYRQALRDVPQQPGFPQNIIWPEEPPKRTQVELDQDILYFRETAKVSMRQARLALKQQGLLATVQSNINALPEESQIEWEYATTVERKSPLVVSLGTALGLTEEDLDNLFKLAITL